MSVDDATQIARQRDDLTQIHATHAIAADLRAAAAAERHAKRKRREPVRDPFAHYTADFAAMFGACR